MIVRRATLEELEKALEESGNEEDETELIGGFFWLILMLAVVFYAVAKQNNFWKKCPKCGHHQWRVTERHLKTNLVEKTITCKNCGYQKKTQKKVSPGSGMASAAGFIAGSLSGGSSDSSFGGGGGGSSGGGGSFGGGGSSGRW